MRKSWAYLLGSTLILLSIIFSQGCSKSTGSSTTLVGNWSRSSDFDGNARSEAVSFTIGDYAYICAGTTDITRYKDLWEYSIARQYWSQKADLPGAARNSAVGFSIGTKGYVGTGYDGTNSLNDLWQYDPTSNTWTQKASIGGTKRSQAMVFVLNNKAYVVSGNNNGSALNDLWMYDDGANSWTEKRQISNVSTDSYDDNYTSIVRYNGVAFTMDSLAYVTGGESPSLTSTAWEYNPSTDLWTQKTAFEGTPRTGAVAFTLKDPTTNKDRGFIITGRNGSLSFDNCYEWHPFDAVNANDN